MRKKLKKHFNLLMGIIIAIVIAMLGVIVIFKTFFGIIFLYYTGNLVNFSQSSIHVIIIIYAITIIGLILSGIFILLLIQTIIKLGEYKK